MIAVSHSCGWRASLLTWERLPISFYTEDSDAPARNCPLCHSTITCGSLSYAGEMSIDEALAESQS